MAIIFVKKGKTNWKYLLLVFVLGVIVGTGSLWLSQKWTIPITQLPEIKKPEKPSQDETADLPSEDLATEDWKTYRNEEYGFEFKYPKEFDRCEPCELKEIDNEIELGEGRFSIEIIKSEWPSLGDYVNKFVNEMKEELSEYEELPEEESAKRDRVEMKKIFVGDNEGFEVIFPNVPDFYIFLSRGNKIYQISHGATTSCLEYAQYEGECKFDYEVPRGFEIFEQMLFTFRFLE